MKGILQFKNKQSIDNWEYFGANATNRFEEFKEFHLLLIVEAAIIKEFQILDPRLQTRSQRQDQLSERFHFMIKLFERVLNHRDHYLIIIW